MFLFSTKQDRNSFNDILDKVKELYNNKKNAMWLTDDLITCWTDIAVLFSLYHPDGFTWFILDSMGNSNPIQKNLIAMNAFNIIADHYHLTFDKTYLYVKRDFASIPSCRRISIATAFNSNDSKIIREFDDEILLKFRHSLHMVLRWTDEQVGGFWKMSKTKKLLIKEIVPKEKLPLIEVLYIALSCISRVPPANTKSLGLIEFLILKYFHIDQNVSKQSRALLISFIKFRPIMRVSVTEILSKMIVNFPCDDALSIRCGLDLLQEFFMIWRDVEYLYEVDSDMKYIDIDIRKRKVFRASLYEAVGLVLLCSTYIGIRSDAIKLLEVIRSLNKELPVHIAEPGVRLLSVIERYENHIINHDEDLYGKYFEKSIHSQCNHTNDVKNFKELAMKCSDDIQSSWAHCLGKLIRFCRIKSHRAVAIAFSFLTPKIESLTQYFIPNTFKDLSINTINIGKREQQSSLSLNNNNSLNISNLSSSSSLSHSTTTTNSSSILSSSNITKKDENILLWRNYVLLTCAIGSGDDVMFASEAGILYALEKTIDYIANLVLPVLFHSNSLYRNYLQFALIYCKRPFAYSLPIYLKELKNSIDKKDIISKDQLLFESVHLFSTLATKYKSEKEDNLNFVEESIQCLKETLDYILDGNFPNSISPLALQSLRYNFFKICIGLFQRKELSPIKLDSNFRIKLLYFTLSHVGFGSYFKQNKDWSNKTKELLNRMVAEQDEIENINIYVLESRNLIYITANEALVSILSTTFSSSSIELISEEKKQVELHVFDYANDTFKGCEHSIGRECARKSIIEIIKSRNGDEQNQLFNEWIDKCYDNNSKVAEEYLLIILELVTGDGSSNLSFCLTPLLNMAFYKFTDSNIQVRKEASKLLQWLCTRFYKIQSYDSFLMYASSNSSSQILENLYNISKQFSKLHKELRCDILNDILKRIYDLPNENQQSMIMYISGWLSHLNLQKDRRSAKNILHTITLLTLYHSEKRPYIIEKMWNSISSNQSNIQVITSFMLSTITERVCIYIFIIFFFFLLFFY